MTARAGGVDAAQATCLLSFRAPWPATLETGRSRRRGARQATRMPTGDEDTPPHAFTAKHSAGHTRAARTPAEPAARLLGQLD
jgi:hypothetical protein